MGYSQQGHKESDMTQELTLLFMYKSTLTSLYLKLRMAGILIGNYIFKYYLSKR